MSAPQTTGISLKRAALVSIALHFFAAALLVVAPHANERSAGNGGGPSREAVRVSAVTIAFRPRAAVLRDVTRAHAPVRRPSATVPVVARPKYVARVAKTLPANVRSATSVTAHSAVADASRDGERIVANTTVAPETPAGSGGARAAPEPAPAVLETAAAIPVVVSAPSASPAVATAAAVAIATARAPGETAVGGWGQSFAKPLVEDDDELAKLQASIHSFGTVSIEVDERGNATRVTLPASLATDARAELEKRFLALRYVPAECNGLRCTGTLQLSL